MITFTKQELLMRAYDRLYKASEAYWNDYYDRLYKASEAYWNDYYEGHDPESTVTDRLHRELETALIDVKIVRDTIYRFVVQEFETENPAYVEHHYRIVKVNLNGEGWPTQYHYADGGLALRHAEELNEAYEAYEYEMNMPMEDEGEQP